MPLSPAFVWGAATAAYQIEGAVDEDGRGESIWDRFVRRPGAIEGGATGAVADDHYHRWRTDLDLVSELGLTAYRFSIAWPRILPEGRGAVNRRGLDFYSRLVDGLLERDVRPFVTLYHWDLPQALEDADGGWRARSTADRFADYAAIVFDALGDRVADWITLNEPYVSAFVGHHQGTHPPGLHDLAAAVAAAHHLLLGHGRAVDAFRASGRPGRIGITLDLQVSAPATDEDGDVEAAVLSDGATNRWFLDPLFRSAYPADIVSLFEANGARVAGVIGPGDLDTIGTSLDFLGLNYYFRRRIRAAAEGFGWRELPANGGAQPNEMGWNVDPSGLTEQLRRIRREYTELPIHVTENGIALRDEPGPDGRVVDDARIAYLEAHVAAIEEAIEAGVDVRGYFVWSLLDNFEWAHGYRPRFGLVHVDYATQRRTPKASAAWYADLVRANGLRG
ncbi:MAG TPA: GH1 family beta-glucosidase [Candidatus Limnocylindrales bacterium]|nr:GH1 family beta-glucosidase [Candidatus Limnocylindrales bacterium]